MPISPIKKNNVSDEVFKQMKTNIVSGEWEPGHKIPSESELVKLFGVSRISIRSAINRLNGLGILITRQGEGTFVSDLSPDISMNFLIPMILFDKGQLLEVLEFRRIIEIENANLAAQRASLEDIREMEDTIIKMKKYAGDAKRFAREDSNFHLSLAKAAKNSIMYKVNLIIKELLITHQVKIQEMFGPEGGLKYHPLILDAIKKRDSKLAVKIMKEHIGVTIRNVESSKYYENQS